MNKIFFLQLVFNASLLLTLALIYDLLAIRWRVGRASLRQVPVGFIVGAIGVIVMLASWKMEPKIVFDTRSILIGVSGLYFGTVPTLTAMAVTAAFRFSIGGAASAMGIAVIITSGIIGIGWRRVRHSHLADISWGELFLFGTLIHVAMLGCTLFLPRAIWWHVFSNIALPVMTVYPVVTALLGRLMADHLKREQTNCRLQESEERYQNLARISPVGIFRADLDGATTYVNPMWCRISGLTEADALGFGWLAAVHPDDRVALSAGWLETTRLRRPSFADYRFRHRDGTVVWVMGQATPEMNAQDQIVGYVGTITDISERKRAEEMNRSRLAEKEALLKEVHHRVKNNLMTIIGLVRMQEAKAQGGALNELLRELEGRIRSMAMVHENLYKSENFARVGLQSYIEGMAAHIHAQFGSQRSVRFRVQVAAVEIGLDLAVPCGLILNELITNAFKHAFPSGRPGAGSGECEIAITAEALGGGFRLTVADNGVGLPANLDWEKSETLGLRLVSMLSRQMQGTIEVERSNGTVIRLKFPAPAPGSVSD